MIPLMVVLGIVLAERMFELLLSMRHEQALLARGGRRVTPDGFWGLVVVHAAFFPAMVIEHRLAPWAGWHLASWWLLGGVVLTMALRYWAVLTLGERWCTRVVVLPGAPLVMAGPYRFARHPNYVAAGIELFVLPAAFGLWVTAFATTLGKLLALRVRLRIEEASLNAASGAG